MTLVGMSVVIFALLRLAPAIPILVNGRVRDHIDVHVAATKVINQAEHRLHPINEGRRSLRFGDDKCNRGSWAD